MTVISRWMEWITGASARALAKGLTADYPRRSYNGIELIFADPGRAHMAEQFLSHTAESLAMAASSAPQAYADLR